MTGTIIELVALLLLAVLSFFVSSAETTFFSLNPIQIHGIRRTRPRAAREIEAMLAAPTQLLSTILILNTVANIAAATLGFVVFERISPVYGEMISILAMTLLLLVFCEVAPKRHAFGRAEHLAVLYLPAVAWAIRLLTPARILLDRLTRSFEKYFQAKAGSMTSEELRTAIDVSHEEGILNKEERAMVDGIIRLEKLQASHIMTPRVDLTGIDLDRPLEENIATARKARLKYLPVYRKTLDHIEGFLDVFKFLVSPDHDLKACLIPHFYVPDTAPLDGLLTMFQHENLRLAIVIDEYGGTAGLITRGDILEEIVQDVEREHATPRLRIEPQGNNRWLVDGGMSLEDVNDQLDLKIEAEGVDRISGWITAQTQRLPKAGEVVEGPGCRMTVLELKKRRVRTVLIEKT